MFSDCQCRAVINTCFDIVCTLCLSCWIGSGSAQLNIFNHQCRNHLQPVGELNPSIPPRQIERWVLHRGGWGIGTGVPLPNRLRGLGSVVSSPTRVRGREPRPPMNFDIFEVHRTIHKKLNFS